jgi:hypothetical protein
MVLQSASIVFNDTSSQYNKDLTDFLNRNLETAIRKGGLSFQFKIAKATDLAELRQMGVKKLPAMIINSKSFIGVPDIISEIRSRVKNSKHMAPVKSEEEVINDYQMSELWGNATKDANGIQIHDTPDEEETESLMAAVNKEMQRRGPSMGYTQNEEDEEDKQRMRRPAPPKPSRVSENDMEDNEPAPPRRPVQTNNRPTTPQRPDNIDNPAMADAFESLNNIRTRNATSEDARDDEMMAALLGRISGE